MTSVCSRCIMEDEASESSLEAGYSWQQCQRLSEKEEAMENRRTELLEQLQEGANADVSIEVQTEWICLLRERNQLLHQTRQEEQEMAKEQYIQDLYKLLQDLGTMPFQPKEQQLRKTLASLYHEVSTYCNDHTAERRLRSISAPAAIPPPPLPAPQPSYLQEAKQSQAASLLPDDVTELESKQRDCRVANMQTPFRSHCPVHCRENMIQLISSTDCRKALRPTNCIRSPGGTPAPNKKRCLTNDTGDMLTMALQNKFRCVYGSPAVSEVTEKSFSSPTSFGQPMGANSSMAQSPLSSTPMGQCPTDSISPVTTQGEDKETDKKQHVHPLLVQTI